MMFVNKKNPINSHSIPLGVMPDLAGYFDILILYFHSCSVILDKLKSFMIIITFEIQSLMQQSCITSFHVIRQCIVLHHDRESVD